MSIRPIVIGAVLVVGAAIAAAALIGPRQVVSAPGSEASPRAISVTGIGDSKARPDVALITSGVVSEAATAREALAKNSAAMAAVIDALKKAGIKEEDIQTSNFNVSPQYPPYQPNQTTAPRISGYQVSNQVTARVTKIADLGAILDTLVQSGANQVNGISFDVAEPKAALNDARKEAVADARAKAELYAQAAGVKLGRVLAISESSNVVPPMPMAFRAMDKVEAQAVPIAAGQVTLNANVSIVYEIE